MLKKSVVNGNLFFNLAPRCLAGVPGLGIGGEGARDRQKGHGDSGDKDTVHSTGGTVLSPAGALATPSNYYAPTLVRVLRLPR